MKFKILIISIAILFFNCKSTATMAEISFLKSTVASKNFEANFTTASPIGLGNVRGIENLLPAGSTSGNINLVGAVNYVKVKNDSIQFDLPFFGQKYTSISYGVADGYRYNGKIKEQKSTFNADKNSYTITYTLENSKENLQLYVTLFANKTSDLKINSNHRSSILYRGKWKEK